MRFELEVIDGPLKGKRFSLRKGLLIGRTTGSLQFEDALMADQHGVIELDTKNSWNFECLAPNKVRLGSVEQQRVALLPGLIFHIGQTGFKVVEKRNLAFDTWEEGLEAWFKDNPGKFVEKEFFFFLKPVSLSFIQGPQFEEFMTLSYGPRILGYGNLDLTLKDPTAPQKAVQFFQVGDQCYIESLCGDRVTINSQPFDQHPVKDGDLLKINSTIIELSTTK